MTFKVLTMWGPPYISLVDAPGDFVGMVGMFAEVFYGLEVRELPNSQISINYKRFLNTGTHELYI